MYCPRCGNEIRNGEYFCQNCGMRFNSSYNMMPQYAGVMPNDSPSFMFALIGFFFPIIGLILYLVYDSKSPKKAKSAGKGALTSVILRVVATIVFVMVYIVFIAGIIDYSSNMINDAENSSYSETEDGDLDKVDVTFGDFIVKNNDFYAETSLEVKVKNLSDSRSTFFITIEAVDEDGVRLGTSTVYADSLNSGQEIYAEAFDYVEEDKLDQYKNAEFKVLEVQQYSF
ncbi:MAG: zinc-ribbon domain-containing protein [Eubacterium sp.]|nr:zinc-ribbon domain-containing protein [Eubacterium sp.]